jgi:acyl transferase domain-containing protein/NADPH:quinone reductase-like Zn-dependent oxidoreductase/NAD(P)-dependent dehydrogenase (short-subunit alcohol dehydrogenase family)/acyl carrier protein
MSTSEPETHRDVLQRALSAVKDLRARLATAEHANTEPIAIIGIGCRFPGGARDPESFWRLLSDGVDAIGEVPADRWDADAYYDADPQAAGKITTKQGGFLDQVDRFDAAFFRIAPREAVHLDPQHRLLLEVAWEALERAGQTRASLDGSSTGVFVGITTGDYGEILRRAGAEGLDAYFPTGNAFNAAAGRLSYLLGLQGPSMAVDAACASSLVAIHLACQSLHTGDCRLALAGGVNLMLEPDAHIAMSRAHALAPDGRCKTFDASADGYGRGEGCGVVVLKRLSDAIADRDPILAVVRGSAVMQDGHSGGLTVPNGAAQQAVIRAALAHAGVAPGDVSYVEAHGTGTSLGDPIEVRALGAVFGPGRSPEHPLVLGSVKTNIGHLESAAGVAGLIKVVLALQHRAIPPHLHVRALNPDVAQEPMPKLIPSATMPWPEGPRIAGVSAFGLSGTIAHLVVEEAPVAPSAEVEPDRALVLPISAHSPEALREIATAYHDVLSGPDAPAVRDLCYSAAVRRTHHDHRLAAVGQTHAELAGALSAFLAGEPRSGLASGIRAGSAAHKLVFVFPGQGGQWSGMAQDLLASEPVFADAIAACEAALRPHVEWSLRELLAASPASPLLERIDVIQPALFSIQVALAALWRSLGIVPAAVIGHSMGEIAAAHVAGALSLSDAARIIARRSRLMRTISGRGAMAVLELPLADAERALAGREDRLSIAASNGPTTTVVSGEPAALSELLDELGRREVFCRPVKVDVASHSPQVDVLGPELHAALAGLAPRPASVAFHSTVTGEAIDGRELDAAYWESNLRRPVLFAPVVEQLIAQGHDLFVELSPHPVLGGALQQLLQGHGEAGGVFASLRRDEPGRTLLLGALGGLYAHGYPVDWSRLFPAPGHVVPLPSYPWQRERFWIEASELAAGRRTRGSQAPSHASPLLGDALHSPGLDEAIFESEISLDALPFLTDHRIDHEVVVPGASHVVRLLCAAEQLHGAAACVLEGVSFPSALVLPEAEVRTAQLIVDRDGRFRTVTAPRGSEADEAAWVVHAAGRLRKAGDALAIAESLDDIRARCRDHKTGAEFYDEMSRASYHLGPSFQWIESIDHREGEALGQMRAPRNRDEAEGYPIFPGLLDSCCQLLAITSGASSPSVMAETGALYVPVAVTHMQLHRRVGAAPVVCHVTLGERTGDEVAAALRLRDAQGVIAEISFRGKRVDRERFVHGAAAPRDLFYRTDWQRAAAPARPTRSAGRYLVLADRGDVAARLTALLDARGATCTRVTAAVLRDAAAVRRAVDDALHGDVPLAGVVHLGSLDAPPYATTGLASLDAARTTGCDSILHVVQALVQAAPRHAPRLHLVTAGAQAIGDASSVSPAQTAVWGLARVVAHEHPELRCACSDLSLTPSAAEIAGLVDEIVADDREDQVALRDDARHVARLVPHALAEAAAPAKPLAATAPAGGQPFRLEIDAPGVLEELVLRAVPRPAPRADEVEIEVRAAGINFHDVLSALGILHDHGDGRTQLGGECAGIVTRIGAEVTQVKPGDAVIAALVPDAFSSFVRVSERFVVPRPAHIGFEDAATLPITFMTAHWAMHHKARLAPGERILIHAAAGGVGLAAVQLARAAGAEIFATAGSDEKRAYLRSLGVEYVMDSRSLAFADEIRAQTRGEGVDAVLNCLTGDAMVASVGVLRPHGRFLEIGKRDIYEDHKLGLYPFRRNLSYFAIDLVQMFGDRPQQFAALLREVVALVDQHKLTPLPWRAFPISQAQDAFRHLARAQHIGKVVLTFPDAEARLSPSAATASGRFRADASYLITGGLGGLGLAVAGWMVEHGARQLALVGRREPQGAAIDAIAQLERAGARILAVPTDVSQPAEVARLIGTVGRELAPLRGVIHAAGVLDDGVLLNQTAERFAGVMAPKVAGSWNLHQATRSLPLDFFVMFSGAGTLLGSPGQSNYAAANAFLDGLAQARRAEGLPAQSIAWGPWSEVGLAARVERGGRLALRGVASLSPSDGVEALGRVMQDGAAQIAVLPLDVRQCLESYPVLAGSPLFEILARGVPDRATGTAEPAFRHTLSALPPAERRGALEHHLRDHAARVLGLPPARIAVREPLGNLGFDSLMTLELRNRIETSLGLKLSATVVWNYPTIMALAEYLERKLDLVAVEPPGPPTPAVPTAPPPDLTAAVQSLTEDEAAAALAETLSKLTNGDHHAHAR